MYIYICVCVYVYDLYLSDRQADEFAELCELRGLLLRKNLLVLTSHGLELGLVHLS